MLVAFATVLMIPVIMLAVNNRRAMRTLRRLIPILASSLLLVAFFAPSGALASSKNPDVCPSNANTAQKAAVNYLESLSARYLTPISDKYRNVYGYVYNGPADDFVAPTLGRISWGSNIDPDQNVWSTSVYKRTLTLSSFTWMCSNAGRGTWYPFSRMPLTAQAVTHLFPGSYTWDWTLIRTSNMFGWSFNHVISGQFVDEKVFFPDQGYFEWAGEKSWSVYTKDPSCCIAAYYVNSGSYYWSHIPGGGFPPSYRTRAPMTSAQVESLLNITPSGWNVITDPPTGNLGWKFVATVYVPYVGWAAQIGALPFGVLQVFDPVTKTTKVYHRGETPGVLYDTTPATFWACEAGPGAQPCSDPTQS